MPMAGEMKTPMWSGPTARNSILLAPWHLGLLQLGQPGVEHVRGVAVQVDHEVAGVGPGLGPRQVVEVALGVDDEGAVRGEVGGGGDVGHVQRADQTGLHADPEAGQDGLKLTHGAP